MQHHVFEVSIFTSTIFLSYWNPIQISKVIKDICNPINIVETANPDI